MMGSEPLAATQAMAISAGVTPASLATAISVSRIAVRWEEFSSWNTRPPNPSRRPVSPWRYLRSARCPQAATRRQCRGQAPAGRQKLLLGRAFDEAVLDLKTGNGRNAAQFGDGCGPRHAPSGKVGEAGIENLAGPGEFIEAPHDLLEGGDAIGSVRPV